MDTLREIFTSPWFYRTFIIVAAALFIRQLVDGVAFVEALLWALFQGLMFGTVVSGVARLWRRLPR